MAVAVSTMAAVALGVGVGVFIGIPLIGVGAVLGADAIHQWHLRRLG